MKLKSFQRGTAVVELALVLPTVMIMTLLVTEVGRAVMQYNTLAKSVRDAARYLSIQPVNTKVAEAKNLVVYGNTAGTGTPLVPGLTTTNVPTPTWDVGGALPIITTVNVRVTGFTFAPMVNQVFGVTIGPFTFSDIAATMRSHAT